MLKMCHKIIKKGYFLKDYLTFSNSIIEPEIEVEQILDHERTEPSVIDEQLIVNQTS